MVSFYFCSLSNSQCMADESLYPIVYSRNVIELVTVSNEYCKLVEAAGSGSTRDFLGKIQKILPLLYLKVCVVPPLVAGEDLVTEQYVSEVDYNYMQQRIINILGEHDDYLEVFDSEIQLSDGPLAASISENLADIYQDLKNFLMAYQIGDEEIMQSALEECLENFRNYWGQKLVNCQRAVHQLVYSDIDLEHHLENSAPGEDVSGKGQYNKPDWLNQMFNDQED